MMKQNMNRILIVDDESDIKLTFEKGSRVMSCLKSRYMTYLVRFHSYCSGHHQSSQRIFYI